MGLKRRIRGVLDRAARASGVLARYEARMRRGLTVLMYHRVLPEERCRDYPFASLVMPARAFREQVRWLSAHCEVLPLGEALARNAEQLRAPRGAGDKPLVAVTFDDGYADNHELAAPALEEFGLRGTFFVTTGFVEQRTPMWYDRAAELWARTSAPPRASREFQGWMAFLKRVRPDTRERLLRRLETRTGPLAEVPGCEPMTIAEVADLGARGHEVGSHTVSHGILPQYSDAELRAELVRSRDTLGAWLGAPVKGFCYPNGTFDARSVQFAREAGYEHACLTRPGLQAPGGDPLRVPRLDMTPDRVTNAQLAHDELAWRLELSGLRERLR